MNNSNAQDNNVNQGRAMVYRLLSALFAKEVDQPLLHELTSAQAQAFLAQLASDPLLGADVAKINAVLLGLTTDKALLELAADYCGLFLVGTKHSASPYASLYMANDKQDDDDVLLFGEQHQQMLDHLEQSQLQVQSEFPEPADHLAVILAYVAHQAERADSTTQQAFINNYLNSWLKTFSDKVSQCDNGQFYTALAHLTTHWVKVDCETLAASQSH